MNALVLLVLFAADARELVAAGNAHLLKKEYDLAEKKYIDALVDAPESPIVQFDLGNSFLGREDFAKARDYYEKALQTRDPALEAAIKYNIGHTFFGEATRGLKDMSDTEKVKHTVELLQQSIRRWRDTLKLAPEHADAIHNIAVATAVLKDYIDRVKRFQEEQQKKQEEEKGKDLAQVLEDLKKRQEAEKTRTDAVAAAIDARAPLAAMKERYAAAASLVDGASLDAAKKDAAAGALRALLADPAVVDGAASLQEAEKALGAPSADIEKATAAVKSAVDTVAAKVDAQTKTAAEEHETGKKNQTQLLAETQGVVMGLEQQISGGAVQGAPPGAQPGQGPTQGPPLPPEQKKLMEDVRNLVAQATESQGKAAGSQEAGPEKREALTATAQAQQGAVDKLAEALELLKKNQKDEQKQDQQKQDQQDQQQQQDQQKQDDQKKDEEKKKELSREQAENLLRQMQEKEREKKQEKEKLLQQAYGRRKADKDW